LRSAANRPLSGAHRSCSKRKRGHIGKSGDFLPNADGRSLLIGLSSLKEGCPHAENRGRPTTGRVPKAKICLIYATFWHKAWCLLLGVAGMPIRSFIDPEEFDPEAIALMNEAYEAACKALDYRVARPVLRVIAERIITAARAGERDPVRLQAVALAGIPRD
jgi:hypothetical protein